MIPVKNTFVKILPYFFRGIYAEMKITNEGARVKKEPSQTERFHEIPYDVRKKERPFTGHSPESPAQRGFHFPKYRSSRPLNALP